MSGTLIQLQLGHLMLLLISIVGGVWAVGQVLIVRLERNQDVRFKALNESQSKTAESWDTQFSGLSNQISDQEKARQAGKDHWDKQFAEIESRLSNHRERLVKLETAVDKGPTHEDLGEVHERITEIGQNVSSLAGEFKSVSRTLELIHSFLLNGGKS
jgi:chromosome segregation ATPase